MSYDNEREAKRSFRNSMLLIRQNVSRCVMYERLASGNISNGKGTVFHSAPPLRLISTLPQDEGSHTRFQILASVRLKLYSPPNTPLKPAVWVRVKMGASSDTGIRRCLEFTKASPGAYRKVTLASAVVMS